MANLREAVKDIVVGELTGYSKEEATEWFDNAENYACVNGCIGELIYYSDTEPFAREYHDEIIELMKDFGAEPMSANDMAWFGFEATVPELKEEVLEELFLSDDEYEETKCEIIEKLYKLVNEKDGNISSQLSEMIEEIKTEVE